MDLDMIEQAIMNITGELDKMSAFLHLDRPELKEGEEVEKEVCPECNGEGCESCMEEESEEEDTSPLGAMAKLNSSNLGDIAKSAVESASKGGKPAAMKIDILKTKPGVKRAFA